MLRKHNWAVSAHHCLFHQYFKWVNLKARVEKSNRHSLERALPGQRVSRMEKYTEGDPLASQGFWLYWYDSQGQSVFWAWEPLMNYRPEENELSFYGSIFASSQLGAQRSFMKYCLSSWNKWIYKQSIIAVIHHRLFLHEVNMRKQEDTWKETTLSSCLHRMISAHASIISDKDTKHSRLVCIATFCRQV